MRNQAVRTICAIAPDLRDGECGRGIRLGWGRRRPRPGAHNNKRRSGSISPPLPGHCSCVAKLEARVDVAYLKPDATDEPIEEALEILFHARCFPPTRQPRVGPPVDGRGQAVYFPCQL